MAGTLVFAISGTNVASEKNMDIFGAAVIAFVTAVGGGTLRDIMIGSHPVGWMQDPNYLYMIGAGIGASIFLKKYIQKFTKTMFLFDSIGIGLYTLLGMQKTLGLGLAPVIAVLMGAVSASFGGVVRDVLVNRIPLIFRSELYATACILGGVVFLLLQAASVPEQWNMGISIAFVIALRVVAVKFKLGLPTLS